GTTYWVPGRLQRERPPGEARAPPPPDLRGLRVLLIDDSDTSRAFLEEQLRAWGLRTDGASDGRSALPRLRAALEAGDPYALVLLDALMPGVSGRQLVRAIHAAPALSRTPVVLLTAIGEKDPHPPGVVATLAKPVRETRLAECLASVAGHLTPRVTRSSAADRQYEDYREQQDHDRDEEARVGAEAGDVRVDAADV